MAAILIILVYFIPFIVAKSRGHNNSGSIFVINLFLGWTFIGWVIALAMSMGGNVKKDSTKPD